MDDSKVIAAYARALLDSCDDIDTELPGAPYSMSAAQLQIATALVCIRRQAVMIMHLAGSDL